MILNIIYLLKNSLIGRGNLSKGGFYEALFPKFDGVYKIFLLHTSLKTIFLVWRDHFPVAKNGPTRLQ